MADFSEFTGPSQEWLALEPTLPKPQDWPVQEWKEITNKGRDAISAEEMKSQGLAEKVIISDLSIPSRDGGVIEARSYRTLSVSKSQRLPVYINLHGGGFLFGTVPSEDADCSRAAIALADAGLQIMVINVNYRHTPEYKYPTAWDDVEDAFHWIHDNMEGLGGDGEKVVIGGTSAGAWLAASLTLQQHLHQGTTDLSKRPKIRGQILMMPCLVHMTCYEKQSKRLKDPMQGSLNLDAPILTFKVMKMFMDLLDVPSPREDDVKLNPGNATAKQVKGLPPTTFGVAGRDILRDEGLLYAKLLAENGVPTEVNVFPGLPHGFRRFGAKLSASKKWDQIIHEGIKWSLSNPMPTNRFQINSFNEADPSTTNSLNNPLEAV